MRSTPNCPCDNATLCDVGDILFFYPKHIILACLIVQQLF